LKWLRDVSLALRVGLNGIRLRSLCPLGQGGAAAPCGGELADQVAMRFNGRGEPVDEVPDAR